MSGTVARRSLPVQKSPRPARRPGVSGYASVMAHERDKTGTEHAGFRGVSWPNPSEAVYAAAQPYSGKELGERGV